MKPSTIAPPIVNDGARPHPSPPIEEDGMYTRLLLATIVVASIASGEAIAQGVPGGCMDAAEKDVKARREQPMAARVLPCTATANGGKACTQQDRVIEVDATRGAGKVTHVYICNFPAVRLLSTR